jgi:molecular chaperone DnaK (HSP70)
MTGRLAIDFGTSNTVLALWDETRREGVPFAIPEFSRSLKQGSESIAIIPSIIHYSADNRRWIGEQVHQRNLNQSPHTFRWMKRYISARSQMKVRLNGKEMTPQQAGADFLSTVLLFAKQEINLIDEEVAFSVPVDAYEHYENWLFSVAETAGLSRFRLIDEPSAAALGYGTHIQPGNVYFIFDFGGGTLNTSVVLVENEETVAGTGKRCRVLGKSGKSIGGSTIDQWLFEEILQKNQCADSEDTVRKLSNAILVEAERVKEKLSFEKQADLSVMDPDTGTLIAAEFNQTDFESILDRHNLFSEINQSVRSALNGARERGYDEDAIQAVLMVGGSSQIPAVQRAVQQIFGKERVQSNRPLDAIARGTAAFVSGVDFYDHIQHDYAIRFLNPQIGTYDFRPIVPRGTPYPTDKPVARLMIKASYDGQRQLGLAIFEMGQQRQQSNQEMELVFDPGGAARIVQVTPAEQEERLQFWMNEHTPTFLVADPPGKQGDPRFEVEFNVDSNKRLTITARDVLTGRLTHQNYPVIRLS